MTNKEITSLAFKVTAIFVLLLTIPQITQLGYFYTNFFPDTTTYLYLIPFGVIIFLLSVFFILWKLSNNIANIMVKEENVRDDLRVDQPFILNIIGFYLLLNGLLELSSAGISLIVMQGNLSDSINNLVISADQKFQSVFFAIGSFIKIILALTLILRSKGWIKLFRKIRQL